MILLAKVPREVRSYFRENSENLALGYLAAALRREGRTIRLYDGALERVPLDEACARVCELAKTEHPVVVGFTISDFTYIGPTVEAIGRLRSSGYAGHITMGGHAPTFNYRETLDLCPGLDSIVRYEGETAMCRLADHLAEGTDWRQCPSLVYRGNGGEVTVNQPECPTADLDDYSFPARDYLPYVVDNLGDTGIVAMVASRGCHADCGFCSIRRFYDIPGCRPWRQRSVKNIFAEIRGILEEHPGVREIVFVDDNFTHPGSGKMERLAELEREAKALPVPMMFSISERVDGIDEGTAAAFRRIGVRQVLLGLESGDPALLAKMNKHIRPEDHARALGLLRAQGIDVACSFITFTPWSRLEQVRNDAGYFASLGFNMVQGLLNRFQVYDGTPLAEELHRTGRITGSFPEYDYVADDPRCDALYRFVAKQFGPVLQMAYQLKVAERHLRFELFQAELNGNAMVAAETRRTRARFDKLVARAMYDVVALFEEAMGLVEYGGIDRGISFEVQCTGEEEFAARVSRAALGWLAAVDFADRIRPATSARARQGAPK